MSQTKQYETVICVAAAIVAVAAIIVTMSFQPVYLFWLMVPLVWIALSKKPGKLGISRANITKATLLGLGIGILIGVAKYYLSPHVPWLTVGFLKYATEYVPKVGVPAYIAMIIAGDAVRELFYRGFIQTRLMKMKIISPYIAIFFAALLLGLTDQIEGIYSIVDATINGLIGGYLLYRTKNLAAPVAFMPIQFIVVLLLSI